MDFAAQGRISQKIKTANCCEMLQEKLYCTHNEAERTSGFKPGVHPVIVSEDVTFVSFCGLLKVSTPFIYPRFFFLFSAAHAPQSSLFDLLENCQLIV